MMKYVFYVDYIMSGQFGLGNTYFKDFPVILSISLEIKPEKTQEWKYNILLMNWK